KLYVGIEGAVGAFGRAERNVQVNCKRGTRIHQISQLGEPQLRYCGRINIIFQDDSDDFMLAQGEIECLKQLSLPGQATVDLTRRLSRILSSTTATKLWALLAAAAWGLSIRRAI